MPRIGVLVTHGTDTLAWSLPVVRYALKRNHANVCLTGSQIPLPARAAFSDAFVNIENALRFVSTLEPPNVFAVFNYGRDAFSDSLRKVHRWDPVAFEGERIAQMEFDDIRAHDRSLAVVEPFRLDRLHVVTTGGTIDATPDALGVLARREDHALAYIVDRFAPLFEHLSEDAVMSIDSSNMTFGRLLELAGAVAGCLRETFPDTFADLAFDPDVRVLHTDPFRTRADYEREAEGATGVVLAGYGGGNVNVDPGTAHDLLPLVSRWRAEGVPVVLTSDVPLGTADFVYENGSRAIAAGAIPGADLSVPECQVRLAFLLGHRPLLEAAAAPGGDWLRLLEIAFLSGVRLRNRASRELLARLRPIPLLPTDLLVDRPFEEALSPLRAVEARP